MTGAAARAPLAGRLAWPFVGILLASLTGVALHAPTAAASADPGLFVVLVVSVIVLDLARIDVFDRINLSPASVPSLALAFAFGPLGPIAAELAIAVVRIVRRVPAIKWSFDVGALGLAGAAAAAVWSSGAPAAAPAELGLGVAGALAAYLVTAALLPIVMWLASGDRPLAAWKEQLAWLWPHYVAFGLLAVAVVEFQERLGLLGVLVFAVPVLLLWVGEQQYLSRSRDSVRQLRERNAQLQQANVRYLEAITTVGHALQARDPDGAGRAERVSQLTQIIGVTLGMSEEDQGALAIGVVVHDIGRVLLRPREGVDMVPELSCRILDPLDLPDIVTDMARCHRDRYDARGAGIPLAARIVAVADALDRLTTPTDARPGLPLRRALAELRAEAGRRYCPAVLSGLEQALAGDITLRRYFGERTWDDIAAVA